MLVKALELSTSDFVSLLIGKPGVDQFRAGAANIGREAVFSSAFDTDTAKARVPERIAGIVNADLKIVRIGLIERVLGANRKFTFGTVESFFTVAENLVPAA